ncbi:putative type I restriction-modification system (methylase S subunit) [Legionella moravica]|uniref:Type I restriction-modification system (Methylase S subunit) n=1 Tax=Legionella moravica TaxID=39962 RepID=A0A378JTC5_9GAMM|nr:restriction endonuclease subunit S [Legionella moravica]KTD34684.1 putative type I restriction-modification system (methylase S subunit) [Legionella moravica]STX61290.1 type I restriction-modification system (methylase_S) [Legionella moravica]
MSYLEYEKYNNSGVDWLGEVPNTWELKKLKYIIEIIQTGTTPSTNDQSFFDGNIDWFNPKDLNHEVLINSEKRITQKAIEKGIMKLFPGNSTLIVGIGATTGKTAFLKHAGTFNQQITGFKSKNHSNKFLFYLLKSMSNVFLKIANYTTLPILNNEFFKSLLLSIPPLKEQNAIVTFLDKKTSEIDALIEKKIKLIQLLEEKRSALISQVVTKGLEHNVPMKDSGVEWMGDIPKHWQIIPFKHVIYFQEGPGIMAVDFVDQGVPLLRIRNLTSNKVQLEGCNYLHPEKVEQVWKQFKLDIGDLLISTSATTGLVSSVGYEAVGSIPYTGIIRLKPKNKSISNEYIKLIVSSSLFFTQIDLLKTGSTIQHFGPLHLNQMFICLPPSDEQGEIVIFLNSQTEKIDEIKSKILEAIGRLKEYRSALITNVVTGKIKVSNINVDLPEPEKFKCSSGGYL